MWHVGTSSWHGHKQTGHGTVTISGGKTGHIHLMQVVFFIWELHATRICCFSLSVRATKKNGKAASENVLLRVNVRMIQNSAPFHCVTRVTKTKTTQSNLETPWVSWSVITKQICLIIAFFCCMGDIRRLLHLLENYCFKLLFNISAVSQRHDPNPKYPKTSQEDMWTTKSLKHIVKRKFGGIWMYRGRWSVNTVNTLYVHLLSVTLWFQTNFWYFIDGIKIFPNPIYTPHES